MTVPHERGLPNRQRGIVTANVQIKRAAIPRAGYEYQDLAGIEVLIRQYRDPELYAWVLLEADDTAFRALDDVVAARKDGSYEFVQVKFTVDSNRYEPHWDWLLAKTKNGTSMLEQWAKSLARVAAMGPIHSAGLKTNRIPSQEFTECLKGTRVDLDLLPREIWEVSRECVRRRRRGQGVLPRLRFLWRSAGPRRIRKLFARSARAYRHRFAWLARLPPQRAALGDLPEPARARWTYSAKACCTAHHEAPAAADPTGLYRPRRLPPAERGLR